MRRVLLSLLRGSILEPDVAVSYALELGRDNPEYMRSVLTNIDRKDEQYYRRLEAAYVVTCEQRYGVSSQAVTQCATDKMAERSAALALTMMDNLEDPDIMLVGEMREIGWGREKMKPKRKHQIWQEV